MKVLIMGASGSGTTTLGKALAKKLSFHHLDVDDYYWKKTDPPFQQKVMPSLRRKNLLQDFSSHENVFVSGSLVSWGDEWLKRFDLVVFIRIAQELRMKRLQKRERERYGSRLDTDATVRKTSAAFMEWCTKYDDPDFKGRSITIHKEWLAKLTCQIQPIDGALDLEENLRFITKKIDELH